MKTAIVLVEPGTLADDASVELDDTELHHVRVRRIDIDQPVLVLDGAGSAAMGMIVPRGSRATVKIGSVRVVPMPAETLLAVGAGEKDRFMLLAERCTELGVTRLVPLETTRSLTVDSRWRDSQRERGQKRAREACKQSGNLWATIVEESCPLEELRTRYPIATWYLADLEGTPLRTVAPHDALGWIIGPEGGLNDAELAYCRTTLAAVPVKLGASVLRFDTAAIVAAALTTDRRGI